MYSLPPHPTPSRMVKTPRSPDLGVKGIVCHSSIHLDLLFPDPSEWGGCPSFSLGKNGVGNSGWSSHGAKRPSWATYASVSARPGKELSSELQFLSILKAGSWEENKTTYLLPFRKCVGGLRLYLLCWRSLGLLSSLILLLLLLLFWTYRTESQTKETSFLSLPPRLPHWGPPTGSWSGALAP